MYQAALQTSLPIVSQDICSTICAMLVVWGNTSEFTLNHRLVCELRYAQERFHINGSLCPDPDFVVEVQRKILQLEEHYNKYRQVPHDIDDLFLNRYGFRFNRG